MWSEQWDKVSYHRRRALKTRSRLLERLRHKSKFDWDLTQRPFFNSKHIRWASHWNGRNGPKWHRYWPEEGAPKQREGEEEGGNKVEAPESNGSVLSQREKLWKQQMEAMRNRIERDPYEAVFGKRFEPFWSPLVPSWMREEMGLSNWSKKSESDHSKETAKKKNGQEASQDVKKTTEPHDMMVDNQVDAKATDEIDRGSMSKDPKPQTQSYSSYSSTSWDSWTNKTRCTEWDSMSGQLKRYVYDPVTNRMVMIEEPESLKTNNSLPAAAKYEACPSRNSVRTESKVINVEDDASMASTLHNLSVDVGPPIDTSAKELTDAESTLPVSTSNGQAQQSHKSDAEPSEPKRPAALSKLPEDDLDLLTAEDVRASMGKVKHTPKTSTPAERAALESAFDKIANSSESEVHMYTVPKECGPAAVGSLTQQRSGTSTSISNWEQGEDATFPEQKLIRSEMDSNLLSNEELNEVHVEPRQSEPGNLSQQLQAHERKLGHSFQGAVEEKVTMQIPKAGTREFNKQLDEDKVTTRVQVSPERELAAKSAAAQEVAPPTVLQPALDRMQSKDDLAELDDSAAHESTETLASPQPINLPKDWAKQTDILQTDRIKRTLPKQPYPYQIPRWVDDMNARKAAWQESHPPRQLSTEEVAVNEKLRRANELLEAEVKEQKLQMAEHEGRYAHKIQSLRQELETAYKQSALHSEKHLERIGFLQSELERIQRAVGESTNVKTPTEKNGVDPLKSMQGEGDFCSNITKFAESHKWYKQPVATVQPTPRELGQEEDKAKDHALIKEVREIYETKYGKIDVNHRQPLPEPENQDVNEASAKDENRRSWDDVGLEGNIVTSGETENKARDDALARFETISRRKPRQVVEVESDVDLGEALAEHEKEQHYDYRPNDNLADVLSEHEKVGQYNFKPDKLEAEIQAQEREASEAQVLLTPKNLSKMRKMNAENHLPATPTQNTKLDSNRGTDLNSAGVRSDFVNTAQFTENVKSTVQWEEPPVYKVLAYDSGNDKFSTATTTANFTGSESPISIPQALSKLYQPARFVPYFAELQQDGYQVIYGTRDLLVFKKVKKPVAQAKEADKAIAGEVSTTLQDHGLVKPMKNALAQEAADLHDKFPPMPKKAKDYDPTSIENGNLMPYEAVLAKEAAEAYDTANERTVNPIDGTSKSNLPPPSSGDKGVQTSTGADYEIKHYPRVRREEPVFTGTRSKWNDRHDRHGRRTSGAEREEKRRGALRWMLSVGFSAAALTYIVGVAAESARQEKVERERRKWQSGRW